MSERFELEAVRNASVRLYMDDQKRRAANRLAFATLFASAAFLTAYPAGVTVLALALWNAVTVNKAVRHRHETARAQRYIALIKQASDLPEKSSRATARKSTAKTALSPQP